MDEKNKKNVDFNCDISQIDFDKNNEFDILDYVSSVNIPCGIHDGEPVGIKNTIEHCKFKNKVIGASIGFPQQPKKKTKTAFSPENLTADEIEAIVLYQLGALNAFSKANSLVIEYVRPSGLMYETAAKNLEFSVAIAKAVKKFSKWLLYYGASTEILKQAAAEAGINYAAEVCLDCVYDVDGLPDFSSENKLETGMSLIRMRRLSNLSELEVADGSHKQIDFDTVHFSSASSNIEELLREANKIITPHPVNYNKAVPSGWV